MKTQTTRPGITFAVHRVERATKPLPTCKTHEALNRLLDRPTAACCDYTAEKSGELWHVRTGLGLLGFSFVLFVASAFTDD
jgi:hypothetical protein